MSWSGIVGENFTVEQFEDYVAKIAPGAKWKPESIVLHNTGAPTLKQWHSHPGHERMKNLASYYQGLGWSSGPHLFVADDYIWVFTPLDHKGTHSPSYNSTHLGIEQVGDFNIEEYNSDLGAKVRDNAVAAMAILCMAYGIDSHTILFHKEDKKTTHKDCPGKNCVKADVLARVHNEIVRRRDILETT